MSVTLLTSHELISWLNSPPTNIYDMLVTRPVFQIDASGSLNVEPLLNI